jgi:RHS repeat-associated protein
VPYVSSATYNARGQVVEQRLDTGSNGLTRQYVYDTNTMRLTTLRAGVSSPYTNLQNLSYTYDAVGNIASLVDGVNSNQRQCFQYDALDRLTNAFTGNSGCTAYATGGTGPYNHTYAYNAIGNITSYAGNAYTYGDSAHKHAVTGAYGNSYGYDGNGNQTTRTIAGTTYTFTFDFENRLIEVKQGATSLATFLYDADGNRVKGTVSGVTTVYIAGIYERQGAAAASYYEGGGLRRSGYTSNNGVFYMLSDHLKSTSALVARNGVLNVKYFYYPYGARRGVPFNSITAKRFTSQYHKTALPGGEGLYFYNARWYDPAIGRFLAADSIVPNPGDSQTLNRYMYVAGNPLKYVDPSGHGWIIPPAFQPILHVLEDYGLLNPMAPFYLLPVALGRYEQQREAATGEKASEALAMTADWYFEQGSADRELGPDSQITQALIRDEGVAQARQVYMQGGNRDMVGQNSHEYQFGLRDAAREFQDVVKRGDWSTSFLGGYDIQIKTVSVEVRHTITEFTVTNETGWQSATRVWGISFKQNEPRSDPGPGGTVTQRYQWRERVPRRANSSQRGMLAQ